MEKPSPTQIKMLRRMSNRGDISPYGSEWRTVVCLKKLGLCEASPDAFGVYRITAAGVAILELYAVPQ